MTTHPKFIAAQYRAKPVADFAHIAQEIVNSDPVIRIFAACEWDELSSDGKDWVAAIVRETMARAAENGA